MSWHRIGYNLHFRVINETIRASSIEWHVPVIFQTHLDMLCVLVFFPIMQSFTRYLVNSICSNDKKPILNQTSLNFKFVVEKTIANSGR